MAPMRGVAGVIVTFGDAAYTDKGTYVPSKASLTTADAAGFYNLTIPAVGRYDVWVDARIIGSAEVTFPSYRGDLLVPSRTCVSRYGTVADGESRRPIANVAVSLGGQTVNSDAEGWYRIDLGCPANGFVGFNTTFIYFSHPDYADKSQVAGRGVSGVIRLDMTLQHR
jgi:hypothetical protein